MVLVDQSEAFLAIAERRLEPFGRRVRLVQARLQDDWCGELGAAPDAVVSMSAIHHLEPAEKQQLYQRCADCLQPGGVLLNGDECRPESDERYLAELQWWNAEKERRSAEGLIPAAFKPDVPEVGRPEHRRLRRRARSGDDCHETVEAQLGYLADAGFSSVGVPVATAPLAVLYGEASASRTDVQREPVRESEL